MSSTSGRLLFKIGATPTTDFQVFLGEKDVTSLIPIKSLALHLDAETYQTTMDLTVYPKGVEILAGAVNVRVVPRASQRLLARLRRLLPWR